MAACRVMNRGQARQRNPTVTGRWRTGAIHHREGARWYVGWMVSIVSKGDKYKCNGRPSHVRNRDGLASPRQHISV
jgi:hypothetical protein